MVTGIPPKLQAGSRALPGIKACRLDRRNTGRSGRKSKPESELTGESGDGRRMQGEGSYLRTRQEEGWVEPERTIEASTRRCAIEGHRQNSYGPFFFGPGHQGWLTDAISSSHATFSRTQGRAAWVLPAYHLAIQSIAHRENDSSFGLLPLSTLR